MPRTVPCPDTTSSHDDHTEDSLEYRTCRENERRRVRQARDAALERLLAHEPAEVSPALDETAEVPRPSQRSPC